MPSRISINDSLWVRGEAIDRTQKNARSESDALRARGAEMFWLKGAKDAEGLQKLRQRLSQSDKHVILARLTHLEMAATRPVLQDRKNFSIVVDDWWSVPHWFMREAEYIIFRNYNGIAFRTGAAPFLEASPSLLFNPSSRLAAYTVATALLRPAAWGMSPLVDAWNLRRRRSEAIRRERYLYFPFPVHEADVELVDEGIQYDFANTGGVLGIFLMRDPFVSFRHTFANLYEDRLRLTDAVVRFANDPYKVYDCRCENRFLPYDEYRKKNRQSRFLIATGGLQNTSVPKYLEYACVGTPMIGRGLPFEYPWLDDCLFPIDAMTRTPAQIKPLLQQALDGYARLRENCLNWRPRLLKLYDMHVLLDLVQAQIDGKPIPEGYLKNSAGGVAGR